jgi:hypothetical protein
MRNISPSNRRFLRHYAEMVFAMFAGMLVLGVPLEGLLHAVGSGTRELEREAPAVVLLGMATTMTIPMVWWMRRMGHGWRPCNEMTASMFLPTALVIGLMGAGAMGFGAAMGFEHALMLPSMLLAMLLRRDEYSCARHAPRAQPA